MMLTRGIREYVARDWQAARTPRTPMGVESLASAREGLRIADELRRQSPGAAARLALSNERRADLLAHVRLASLFRRAAATSRR